MLTVDFTKKLDHFTLSMAFSMNDEIVALIGPSGSGKTTLLNCIAGITQPDAGIIALNGTVFYQSGQKPLKIQKRKTGYLFQDYALFPHLSVEENILYGTKRGSDLSHITALSKLLGISGLLAKYPHQISGGEKQRVALARALAAKPDILLLDEPFSALDDDTRARCQEELHKIHEQWKIPVIFVTHLKADAEKLADRIIKVDQGQMTEQGLLERGGVVGTEILKADFI
ncbi:molybdate transport system ATP-binding protein [Planomicrobium koreense]|uniref:Molybdate transport system ATP-binding protein n=1 Tax=Planococcus koreensis TaxID=112331 RepID=A0A7W8FVU6_9BACL|nr:MULTISPECIES: ATP-binding cassette domain-containing protein [Planococcus]MBB5181222.1 molybdate transport system ATP-binding protein [Planococcus koreensis]MDN3451278.1 ATP-binding cassette domain-containing protein [Planococcus sp. APC 3906]